MRTERVGFALCGSFCTHARVLKELEKLCGEYETVVPVVSEICQATSTRFGTAREFISRVEGLTGHKAIGSVAEAEPIGPKNLLDVLVIAPCTGNTLSKLALGITDTPVTMAVKSTLRVGKPVVLCLASNDALAASGQNAARLMNTKNIYFVPLGQDDPEKKPFSLVADFSLLEETVQAALEGRQLQPVFRCG